MQKNKTQKQFRKIFLIQIFIAVFTVGFFAVSSEARAIEYYVSPSGSDSYSGTSLQPFRTIQKCADISVPGTTCIIKDGTYTPSNKCSSDSGALCAVVLFNKSGTVGLLGNDIYGFNKYDPSTWITFKAENPLGAIISGSNVRHIGFDITGNSAYIRIEGFDITQFKVNAIPVYYPSHDISVYNNTIHHIGRECTDAGDGRGAAFGANTNVQYITIDSNVIHHNGRYANGENGCQNQTGSWQNHDQAIYVSTINHIAITNNIFYSNKAGWPVDLDRGTDNAYVINSFSQ